MSMKCVCTLCCVLSAVLNMPYKLHFYASKTNRNEYKLLFSRNSCIWGEKLGIVKFYTCKVLLYFWQEFTITNTHFEPKLTDVNPKISHLFTSVFIKQKKYSDQSPLLTLDKHIYICQARRQSTKTYNTYQLLHLYIITAWWWATSKPETCLNIVTE
jgi:hypothetical protein